VSRNGDLIHRAWLEIRLPNITPAAASPPAWYGYIPNVIHAMINSIELEIGGQRIDRHYGESMYVMDKLRIPAEKEEVYKWMTGQTWDMPGDNAQREAVANDPSLTDRYFYIPLQFFFCTNPGNALPLVAIQFHEVRFHLDIRPFDELYVHENGDNTYPSPTTPALTECNLLIDYVYLDQDERKRFAAQTHEYLIEQLQFSGDETFTSGSAKVRLSFNHPLKMLVWAAVDETSASKNIRTAANGALQGNYWFNYGPYTKSGAEEGVSTAKLLLNGHERWATRPGVYFRTVVPFAHFIRVPDVQIYTYSFALHPQQHAPSGALNASRIDSMVLELTSSKFTGANAATTGKLKVWAVNYNVVRIVSGMLGLAYSN
jgi:hypothetical protein